MIGQQKNKAYAYASTDKLIMQVHLFFLFFLYLVSWASMLSPLRVSGISNSLVIESFSGLSSFLYVITGFTFSDLHTDLFPLIYFGGGPSNMEL